MKWQPIETAPKDGYFMVYEDEAYRLKLRKDGKWFDTAYPGIVVAPWGDVAVGADAQRMLDIIGPGHKLVVRDGCCDNPTHWMPLPMAPGREAPADEREVVFLPAFEVDIDAIYLKRPDLVGRR